MKKEIKKVSALFVVLSMLFVCVACNKTSVPVDTLSTDANATVAENTSDDTVTTTAETSDDTTTTTKITTVSDTTSATETTTVPDTTSTTQNTTVSVETTFANNEPETPDGVLTEIITNGGATIKTADLKNYDANAESVVYYISDITPEALMAAYKALGTEITGENTAVKIHTGESEQTNYLRPEFIKDLVHHVNGTIVESNTAYGGKRAQTAMHYQVAKDRGFTDIADVVILDETGSVSIPVTGGSVLKENLVGARFTEFDGMLVLSHFKGHLMGGFGGSIKNISIGIASTEGKCLIHTGGKSRTFPWGGKSSVFMDSMAEAGKSVVDALNGNVLFINVMNNLSVDCDCMALPSKPDVHDIGILASADPVALDQACVDLIYNSEGAASIIRRIESLGGEDTLEHGEEIGLGNRSYKLVVINE